MTKRPPSEGDLVRIISGDLEGSEGVIRGVYRAGPRNPLSYSLAILPQKCRGCEGLTRHPDGTIHWLADAEEVELMDRTRGVY